MALAKDFEMTKKSFLRSGEGSVSSYSWVDLADGTGGVTYYISLFGNSTGVEYRLVQDSYYSDYYQDTTFTASTTANLSAFNTPRTAKGTAVISCFGNVAAGEEWNIKVKFQKVSGGVATDISSEITSLNYDPDRYSLIYVPLTETNFKIGDNLRVIITPARVGGGAVNVGCSSLGGRGTAGTYPFIINFPYKIEV
jgi:phosphoserine aminotransferase